MKTSRTKKGLLSGFLAAALFLHPCLTAAAAELPETIPETTAAITPAETVPETTTATSPEETIPETTTATTPVETIPETTAATTPEETIPETTAATEPEETVPETTAATIPEETVPETSATTAPEETVPETTGPLMTPSPSSAPAMFSAAPPSVMPNTIEEILAMREGTSDIAAQGTVVFVMGPQAVLQDHTGGLRLAFKSSPDIQPGDVIQVSGKRTDNGFSVAAHWVTGSRDLPSIATTLANADEEARIFISNAVFHNKSLVQSGFSQPMDTSLAEIPESVQPGDRVDAYGVILDGLFFADTIVPASQPALPPEDLPDQVPEAGGWKFYFGQLHAHSGDTGALGPPEEAYAKAKDAGLDFFALTDYSHSFTDDESGAVGTDGSSISPEWATGKAAAEAATGANFVALYGYEMGWGEGLAIGHISTFNTPGWQSRNQEGFDTLARYCEALATVPGSISQFNHPCPEYGDFGRFRKYDPIQDSVMQLIEVGSEFGRTFYDSYTRALDAGWHLAPTNSENTHNCDFAASEIRTVALAEDLTGENLYAAMASHRIYATEDRDLQILYTINGQIMGCVIPETDILTIGITLSDPSDDAIGTVEVITQGGETAHWESIDTPQAQLSFAVDAGSPYYYLHITQPDGDIAVTAPIWVESFEDLGIESFTADFPQPDIGQEVTLKASLFNNETEEFLPDSLQILHNSTVVASVSSPGSVPALDSRSFSIPYQCPQAGQIRLTLRVTGTIAGIRRSYEEELILQGQPGQVALSAICDARSGLLGEAYRVKGYVTAGTSNPYNTLEDTIYVQDDTGGIAVVDFIDTGIQVGTPIEVTGILHRLDGNLELALTSYQVLDEPYYRYVPRTMTHEVAMDYDTHGGELLQIEGKVVSLSKTADGKGISRFTLQDILGDLATVVIDDGIGSGAYGTNELASQVKKGRTVRAMGLLHVDEFGKTVLRVRNCEEVVYVPPKQDPTNPKTGDIFSFWK